MKINQIFCLIKVKHSFESNGLAVRNFSQLYLHLRCSKPIKKIIPGLFEVLTVDNQVESANAEERSLFRRII